jgi:hypothetical protein
LHSLGTITGFYEKVIKVKADVAALLTSFAKCAKPCMAGSVVKGVP